MKRRSVLLLCAVALAVVSISGPTGRIAIQTHDLADPSPHRVEATLALGKAALVFLVTWSQQLR